MQSNKIFISCKRQKKWKKRWLADRNDCERASVRVRSSRHWSSDRNLIPGVASLPRVEVARWALGGRNAASLVATVAGVRSELVKNLVLTGWQWHSDSGRRTVGDSDATLACTVGGTTWAALTASWRCRIWTGQRRTLDGVAGKFSRCGVQRISETLTTLARRRLDVSAAYSVAGAFMRARETRRCYKSYKRLRLFQKPQRYT